MRRQDDRRRGVNKNPRPQCARCRHAMISSPSSIAATSRISSCAREEACFVFGDSPPSSTAVFQKTFRPSGWRIFAPGSATADARSRLPDIGSPSDGDSITSRSSSTPRGGNLRDPALATIPAGYLNRSSSLAFSFEQSPDGAYGAGPPPPGLPPSGAPCVLGQCRGGARHRQGVRELLAAGKAAASPC